MDNPSHKAIKLFGFMYYPHKFQGTMLFLALATVTTILFATPMPTDTDLADTIFFLWAFCVVAPLFLSIFFTVYELAINAKRIMRVLIKNAFKVLVVVLLAAILMGIILILTKLT